MTHHRNHPLSRRTLARGAAWSVPVVLASVAAPAFATSGQFGATLLSFQFGGTAGWWRFAMTLANDLPVTVTLKRFEVHTTYHSPATNGGASQSVGSFDLMGITLDPGRTLPLGSLSQPFQVPPRKDGVSLMPSYYTDVDAGDADGTIPCTGRTLVYPDDPAYPSAARRLLADQTWIRVYYDADAGEAYVEIPDTRVPCEILDGCVS